MAHLNNNRHQLFGFVERRTVRVFWKCKFAHLSQQEHVARQALNRHNQIALRGATTQNKCAVKNQETIARKERWNSPASSSPSLALHRAIGQIGAMPRELVERARLQQSNEQCSLRTSLEMRRRCALRNEEKRRQCKTLAATFPVVSSYKTKDNWDEIWGQ